MTLLEFLLAAGAVLFVGIVALIVGLNAVAKAESDDWESRDAYATWREGVRLKREALLRERGE